jgi:hypothetical protein
MQIELNKLWCVFFVITLSACQHDAKVVKENTMTLQEQVPMKQTEHWQDVTVKYYDFEGGFYGLVSTTGKKLLPMNLVQKYKVDGTKLRVKGDIIKDMMTIQQWGIAFRITDIELIKIGNGQGKSNTF